MATIDKVDVSFDRPSGATGGLQIRVSRWRHKLSKKDGDSVAFSANGTAMDHMEISWNVGECPFTIPNNVLSVSAGETKNTGPVTLPNPTGRTVRYWITIYFYDENNQSRNAEIDPDMVIDV